MIRIDRTIGTCASCTATSVLAITVSGRTGSGGTRALCDYHARQLVHGVADVADGYCTSCGHRGSVQQVGAATSMVYGGTQRTKYAFSVCLAKCARGLVDRIGVALSLHDGESTEWDDTYEPPSWWQSSQRLANGGRR